MKLFIGILLSLLSLAVHARSQLGLCWTPPVARSDGEPLSFLRIDKYRVWIGTESGEYIHHYEIPGATVCVTLLDLPDRPYYLALTTVDSDGRESGYSNEIKKSPIWR